MAKKNFPLTDEEKDLEAGIARGEWRKVRGKGKRRNEIESAARAGAEARTKEARVNIRMSQGDVNALKATAEQEGIGYQTLMSSVIHKYVSGQLVDRKILDELKSVLAEKRRAS